MFVFFKVCLFFAIATLCSLGLITLSDVFIHNNQVRFQIITVVVALLFFAAGWIGLVFYKNFENICDHLKERKLTASVRSSLRKLLLFFGLTAIILGLISISIALALIQRMAGGTALFG